MKPDMSEFSYGYAVTESMVETAPSGVSAAPLFPSLKEEGAGGGGYDVQIPIVNAVVVLQFKLTKFTEEMFLEEADEMIELVRERRIRSKQERLQEDATFARLRESRRPRQFVAFVARAYFNYVPLVLRFD